MAQNEHVNSICCQREVAGDIISGENVKTIEGNALLNFDAASTSRFRENQNKKSPPIVGQGPLMCTQIFWPCQL